jgi:two-component system response regulator PilR (NtrC family)
VKAPARILVVDDERSLREFLEIFFRREGYAVVTAASVDEALVALGADDFDVVISDVQMAGASGLELLRTVKETAPECVVIMITAFATTETAIEAMKQGAYDYITKPFKVDELRLVVEKALEKKLLADENQRLRTALRSRSKSLVGSSSALARVHDLIAQVATTRTNVLVSGESGTGKELVARAIHDLSERREKPFIAVNCGAIPENLLESELFGHVRGAFTGAVSHKPGLVETADGGTLFLDEIGELPPSLQVKLLRLIQEKTIRRVGGNQDQRADVRIVAATNRDLQAEAQAGRFREDLYYRLNVIQITLPPLRERMEDVPLLVQHFLAKYRRELGKEVKDLAPAAMEKILAHPFPGNVRELENLIERAVALSRGPTLGVDVLPASVLDGGARRLVPPPTVPAPATALVPAAAGNLDEILASYERGLLADALQRAGGVKKRAARLLGISFRSFRYRLEKLGLDDSRHDDDEE